MWVSRPGLGLETDQDHFLRSWSWSWSRPCWSWSWSWSRPPWSWSRSRSRPVWSWSGLGLGLPGLDNISGNFERNSLVCDGPDWPSIFYVRSTPLSESWADPFPLSFLCPPILLPSRPLPPLSVPPFSPAVGGLGSAVSSPEGSRLPTQFDHFETCRVIQQQF